VGDQQLHRAITSTLTSIRDQAGARGIEQLRVVVEPTDIDHRLILRIARRLGFLTGLVDAGHVKKMLPAIRWPSRPWPLRDGTAQAASHGCCFGRSDGVMVMTARTELSLRMAQTA
jgi:hypothetical protein